MNYLDMYTSMYWHVLLACVANYVNYTTGSHTRYVAWHRRGIRNPRSEGGGSQTESASPERNKNRVRGHFRLSFWLFEDVKHPGSQNFLASSLFERLCSPHEHRLHLSSSLGKDAQSLSDPAEGVSAPAPKLGARETSTPHALEDLAEFDVAPCLLRENILVGKNFESCVLKSLRGFSSFTSGTVAAIRVVNPSDDVNMVLVLLVVSIKECVLGGYNATPWFQNTVKLLESGKSVGRVESSLEIIDCIEGVIRDRNFVEVTL